MERLALSLAEMDADYTVVVIGSGYGGGVAASRFARAGQRVCVLERGREWLPGEFPDTEPEALEQMQLSASGKQIGREDALYEFHFDDDISIFKGCGLGGTSLVNANVALEAEPRVFERPCWPSKLKGDPGGLLSLGYQRAREMLRPTPYPEKWPALAKLDAHRRSAERLKERFVRVPINVTFEDGVNHVGVPQQACKLCGDCVTGCNHGAKNTVATTYLADASNHGAKIFTGATVLWLEASGDRWRVHYRPTHDARKAFVDPPDLVVSADVVIVAAGALGSTEILLRSRERGLPLSSRLGEMFTGNGDVLGFGYNNDMPIEGVGFGQHAAEGRQPVGPCITSAVDARGKNPLEDGMIIEEGSLPGAIADFLPLSFALAAKFDGKDTDTGVADYVKEVGRELESVVRGPYHGAIRNTQTYLVMTHDDCQGRMALEEGRLRIRWPGLSKQPIFTKVGARLYECTAANGGTAVPNPMWSNHMKQSLITVHPLGGCAMGDDATRGVTNHRGQVFVGTSGDAVYPGLVVADGSVMPTSLGVNPLLTITAVAERSVALLAQDKRWTVDYALPSRPRAKAAAPKLGLRFTETMKGWFSTAVTGEKGYQDGAARGQRDNSPLRFVLTLSTDDLAALHGDERHRMGMSGTVEAPVLSKQPLSVEHGYFELLPDDPERVGTKSMIYDMQLVAADGKRYHFHGFKVVRNDPGVDVWPDTTTLYTTLRRDDAKGPVIGRGVLWISPGDFARQLTTIEVTGTTSALQRLTAISDFGRFFAGALYETYGGIAAGPRYLKPDAPPRKRRPLRAEVPELHPFRTSDGVLLKLTRYRGGDKGPVMLCHGLGVSSRIFSTDTIDTNLVEYLVAHGFDVWLLDFRVSSELPSALAPCNGDQIATIDYPEAVKRVREVTGAASVQMLVHCYGATVFFMSMLAGLEGVRSAVVSQTAAHVLGAPFVQFKSGLFFPDALAALGVKSLTAYTDSNANWSDRLFDQALNLAPLQLEERCNNPVCHRITFLYSLLYEHDQLNAATHDALHELFGTANISTFEHLGKMVRAGRVVDAAGKDVYMGHPERLKIPLCFIHGAENACWTPEGTAETYAWLCAKNGPGLYRRHVVENFGHIDCIFGKNAVNVTFPLMLAHLEQTAKG